jgi:beta-glucosidase
MYDKHEALFPFGHGLSYTTFEYSDLGMEKETIKDGETLNISLTLTNTGDLSSDEVVQLYVSFPDSEVERPIKALKGFRRIHVPAGESIRVSIPLEADELRYWNVEEHRFVLEKGKINLMIGASSEDIRLKGELEAI